MEKDVCLQNANLCDSENKVASHPSTPDLWGRWLHPRVHWLTISPFQSLPFSPPYDHMLFMAERVCMTLSSLPNLFLPIPHGSDPDV